MVSVSANKGMFSWLLTSRVALAIVGFLGFVNLYALRVNLSVAMVCMLNQTAVQQTKYNRLMMFNDSSVNDSQSPVGKAELTDVQCTGNLGTSQKTLQPKDGEFDWDKETQGIILGAFFWGYLVTQIPGGWLAQRFGGKRVCGYFMLLASVATILSPVGARYSPYILIILRVVNGLGQGVVFPAMHVIWSKWAPPLERSKLIGFTYAGAQIGNVLTLPISAMLCDYGFDGGWGSIFYVFGAFGLVWFLLWMLIVSDTPAQHPRISAEERNYIETSLGSTNSHDTKTGRTPWLKFVKSVPVWAIIVAHTFANWGTYTLLTNIPTYMKEVLKFDIKSNGLFSAIPFIFFWVFINVGGFVADYLRIRGWKTKIVRKLMLSLGTILPAILLTCTGFVTCHNPYVAVAVLSLAVGFSGFQYPGVMVNHVDIAPPFAGVLFGISNTVATLSGVFAPYVIGRLTINSSQAEWRNVFYIASAIYTIGAIFFCIFADGELQGWAKPFMMTDELIDLSTLKSDRSFREVGPNSDAADKPVSPDAEDSLKQH